jgi:hypothetical protein
MADVSFGVEATARQFGLDFVRLRVFEGTRVGCKERTR